MITVYGIKNCDTCAKAKKWLDAEGMNYRFHDIRRDGLDIELLRRWTSVLNWEPLINRRGTTWRNLTADEKQILTDETSPATERSTLILKHPTLIKRPVFDLGDAFLVGFKDAEKETIKSRQQSA